MTDAASSADPADPGTVVRRPARHGIQVFASPSDAPRVRRRTDMVLALVEAALIVFLAVVVGNEAGFDQAWADMLPSMPGWVLWVSQVAYVVAIIATGLFVVGVTLFAKRRKELARDLFLAGALAALLTLGISQLVDARWPEFPLTDLGDTSTTFPAFFITVFVAIQSTAAPFLSAPFRRLGRWVVLLGAAGAVLGGVCQPSDAMGALLVGVVAAALIRFALGTSAGVPSLNRITDGLAELGLTVSGLEYLDDQPPESTLVRGLTADGGAVLARVVGRDAWSNSQWARWWHAAWYSSGGEQHSSTPREQVEHEALVSYLATDAGVTVRELLAVGLTSAGDGMIAGRPQGTVFADLGAHAVTDDVLKAAWAEVIKLHDAGLSHGHLDGDGVWVDDDGVVGLTDFTSAGIAGVAEAKQEDIVELLTASAVAVGPDKAIAAARKALGDDPLVASLAMMQSAALTSRTKNLAHQHKLKVDDLRKQVATAVGVDPPEVESLRRVSLGNILMVALTGFAVYTLISGLADVGFSTIADALDGAKWGLVLVAFVLAQATSATDAMSVVAASPKPVPVGIATIEQFAVGFVDLAVPSNAGRLMVNVRFLGKFGINSVTAATTGAITNVAGIVAQATLMVLTVIVGKGSVDLSQLDTGGGMLKILGFAIVILLIGGVVVLVVSKLRHWVEDKIRKPLSKMGDSLAVMRHPKNIIEMFGGAIATEVLYATGLMLCVLAVGGSVSLGEALFISVTVSLFGGLVPVPGGVGVIEAGLTAGLVGVGVHNNVAIAAVLIYRMISFYLPPIWGWLCMHWLQDRNYL